jgi:hypothetical protein
VTKSGAKTAKSDAQKYYKRRNDPAGLAKIEEGDAAFKDGDFAKAKAFYDEATEICKNSTVDKTAKVKVEKEAKPQSEENVVQQRLVSETISSTKLLLVSTPVTAMTPCMQSIQGLPSQDRLEILQRSSCNPRNQPKWDPKGWYEFAAVQSKGQHPGQAHA